MINPPFSPSLMGLPPVPPAPADASAVAPPNMGGEQQQQPEPTYYEQLRAIYDDAVRLAHMKTRNGARMWKAKDIDEWVRQTASETFKGAHNFRTFGNLVNTLQSHESRGERPITEDDMSQAEKGAIARTALFGHSFLPITDELAGVSSWAGKHTGLSNLLGLKEQGYRAGRNESRRYLENARRFSVNKSLIPGVNLGPVPVPFLNTNPEAWGVPAAIAVGLGGGANPGALSVGPRIPMLARVAGAMSPAEAPGFIRSTATGAGYGLGYGLADQPELTPEALKENAIPLGIDAVAGALLGGGSSLTGRRLTRVRQPGPLHMEEVLNVAGATHPQGGPGALADAVAASGVRRPMLAELENSSFSGLGMELRMQSREGTAVARRLVGEQLAEIRAQRAAFDPAYEALKVPVDDPRIAQLMNNERVKEVARALLKDKQIGEGKPFTGRNIEDIRRELGQRAERAGRKRDTRAQALLLDFERQARAIVDDNFPHMPEVRQQLAPILERQRRLKLIQRRFGLMPRRANVPLETKTTTHSEMMRETGREKFQMAHRGFQQMAEPLFTPGTAAEHLGRIHHALPWYYYLGRAAPLAGYAPQVNPFFNQEPQDSVPQEP